VTLSKLIHTFVGGLGGDGSVVLLVELVFLLVDEEEGFADVIFALVVGLGIPGGKLIDRVEMLIVVGG
jgi:hypothetical protein